MRCHQIVGLCFPLFAYIRLVLGVVGHFSVEDHHLHFAPKQLLFGKSCNLTLLSFRILQEKHSNKEVKKEEAANKDEDNEKDGLFDIALVCRPAVLFGYIHSLVHDIRPAFKRGHNEECHHGLAHIVKVGVVAHPFTALRLTLVLV